MASGGSQVACQGDFHRIDTIVNSGPILSCSRCIPRLGYYIDSKLLVYHTVTLMLTKWRPFNLTGRRVQPESTDIEPLT